MCYILDFFTFFLLNQVATYGCWCTKPFTANHQGHRGQPKDSVDATCKLWGTCHHCETLATCTGHLNDEYTVSFSPGLDDYICDSASECAKNRCECDAPFAIDLANELKIMELEEEFYQLGSNDCYQAGGNGQLHKKDGCCGSAPGWQLYSKKENVCSEGMLILREDVEN